MTSTDRPPWLDEHEAWSKRCDVILQDIKARLAAYYSGGKPMNTAQFPKTKQRMRSKSRFSMRTM
jgi:hypothetical protein